MSVRTPSVYSGLVTNRLSLNLHKCALDLSEMDPKTSRSEYARKFTAALGYMTQLNFDRPDTNGINVAAIKINCVPRASSGSAAVLSLISTPIFVPFSFIPSPCTAKITVTYALADAQGGKTDPRVLEQTVRGRFSGWSFVRFAFRTAVLNRVRAAVPEIAAEMLVEDLQPKRGFQSDKAASAWPGVFGVSGDAKEGTGSHGWVSPRP